MTVGRSESGPCLVNLEAMGSLAVSGEPMACDGLLRALALELATSFWADQFDLVLVGFGQELSRFERVRVLPDGAALVDELEHRQGRRTRPSPHGRLPVVRRGPDGCGVRYLGCAGGVVRPVGRPRRGPDLVDQAGDADTGTAVVVCGEADGVRHRLTLDGTGASSPLDLLGTVVWPQRVEPSEFEGLGGLVTTAADLSSVPASDAPYVSITAPLPRVYRLSNPVRRGDGMRRRP